MNKDRVESLSDSVFAVAMTLLVFDVQVPIVSGIVTNARVIYLLGSIWPLVGSYAFTFLVLSVFWINHQFLFHRFTKTVDRSLNLLNMVYLMFLVFIPFSARLFGTYPNAQAAVLVYGLNILAVALLTATMIRYVRRRSELRNEDLSLLVVRQAQIRIRLTIVSYLIGIFISFFFIPASVLFFLFPIIFNIIPGSLTFTERIFGLLPKAKERAERKRAEAEAFAAASELVDVN